MDVQCLEREWSRRIVSGPSAFRASYFAVVLSACNPGNPQRVTAPVTRGVPAAAEAPSQVGRASTPAPPQALVPDRAFGGGGAGGQAPSDGASVPARPISQGLARGNGDPADHELKLGDEAYQRDQLKTAKAHYGRARALAPRDPAPRVGLLRVRMAEGQIPTDYAALPGDPRVRQLLEETRAIVRLDPRYAPAWLEQGRLALILGDAPQALKALEQAEALDPREAETQSALGVALLATGKAETSLGHFRRAAELDPNDADRLTNLGTAYLMRGMVSEALRAYERAVALAPRDARARGDLGTAYLSANRPEQALAELERAVELAPDRATLLSNLGYAYQLGGKLDLAIKTYRRALDRDSRLGSAWINLGTAYAKQQNFPEAERCLRRALELDPTDPRASANLQELEELKRGQPSPASSVR
jgi:Flp pilus assembly protein TadD